MLDDLKQMLDREPFVAFQIKLTSGEAYRVTTPYQIAIGQTQLDYYHPRSDRKAIIRLNQIVALDEASAA